MSRCVRMQPRVHGLAGSILVQALPREYNNYIWFARPGKIILAKVHRLAMENLPATGRDAKMERKRSLGWGQGARGERQEGR